LLSESGDNSHQKRNESRTRTEPSNRPQHLWIQIEGQQTCGRTDCLVGMDGGSRSSTHSFHRTHQPLHSYPHPPERRTSRLRLLPPGPGQVCPANVVTASLRRPLRDRQPQRTDTHCWTTDKPDALLRLTSAFGPSYRGFTVEAVRPLRGPLTPRLDPPSKIRIIALKYKNL